MLLFGSTGWGSLRVKRSEVWNRIHVREAELPDTAKPSCRTYTLLRIE